MLLIRKHTSSGRPLVRAPGAATVFFSRLLPIVRTFISLPAGVARMPFWRFTAFTALGCLPWMLMLTVTQPSEGEDGEPPERHPATPAGSEMKVRTIGSMRPKKTRRRRSARTSGRPTRGAWA